MLKVNRIHKEEFIFALLYAFRFIFKIFIDNDGNYDAMYILAAYFLLIFLLNQSEYLKGIALFTFLFICIGITATFTSPIAVSALKTFVYIAKIVLCITLYYVVKSRLKQFDIQVFLNYVSILFLVETVFALLYRTTMLWRLYGTGRMELFYLEPSELSVFCGLLVFLQVYMAKRNGSDARKIFNLVILIAVLVLSRGMSGIMYTSFAVVILLIFDNNHRKGAQITQLIFFFGVLVGFGVLFSTDNFVSERFYTILIGEDSSFYTRSQFPIETMLNYYKTYGLGGFGFGNMNTEAGLAFFNLPATNYVICAAVYLFAIEGGIVALIFEIIFVIKTLIHVIRKRSVFHLALFLFVFFYMYFGGYTTNPVVWMLFGLLYSDEQEIYIVADTKKYMRSESQ